MIYGFDKADTLLYHYTKSSTATDYILKDRSLRLSAYMSTNDPKESKTWRFNLHTNEQRDLDKYDTDTLSAWLSAELKSRTRLACFSMDTPPLTGNHLGDIFHRGFCKPRMWAQYAERHTGVCLVFDRSKLQELINRQFATSDLIIGDPVQYINRDVVPRLQDQTYLINVDHLELVGKKTYARQHLLRYYRRFFFEKMTDWRDESEYRWVVAGTSSGDLYVTFDGALVGILFGEYTEDAAIEKIMEMTASWGLEYNGLKWKNCSPWYDLGNVRYLKHP